MNDTIYALSSGRGKSGVAVIRISGSEIAPLFNQLTGRGDADVTPRHAYLADIMDKSGAMIDKCIAIYFRAPASFTGEDVIEIHCHGSAAVIDKMFNALESCGCRMAMPGEFTRRAFENGKMDLVAADGLAALLDARTERQRAHAMRVTAGVDSAVYHDWRNRMIDVAAMSAAMIDYPEDDLPRDIANGIKTKIRDLYDAVTHALTNASGSRAVRSGFNIALVGDVNAGKSSLFNRLLGEARAIVSDIPGTTRDVITAELDIDGYLVRLSDTAGMRDADDVIEKMGIERTINTSENADLILRIETDHEKLILPKPNEITVYNKSDLREDIKRNDEICVSALTGAGMTELLAAIRDKMHHMLDGSESDLAINARTKRHLEDAALDLKAALDTNIPDIAAEHIRRASDGIGRILGTIGVDEVADAVFGQLCLGK